jgi:hypothetical protein
MKARRHRDDGRVTHLERALLSTNEQRHAAEREVRKLRAQIADSRPTFAGALALWSTRVEESHFFLVGLILGSSVATLFWLFFDYLGSKP